MQEELSAIDRQRKKWIDAINRGDAAGFVAVVADDVVWLPARNDAIQGKEKLRAWLETPFASFEYDYRVSGVRLRLAGSWAVEHSKFVTKARAKTGEASPPHEGVYTLL